VVLLLLLPRILLLLLLLLIATRLPTPQPAQSAPRVGCPPWEGWGRAACAAAAASRLSRACRRYIITEGSLLYCEFLKKYLVLILQ